MQKELTLNNKFVQLWLIILSIICFILVIFLIILYLNKNTLNGLSNNIKNEVYFILVLLSIFGVFIGSLGYYFISEKDKKALGKVHKDAHSTLKFLDTKERKIVSIIINHNGKISQSSLCKETECSRVVLSRCLRKLEEKGIITKKPNGMTNIIKLDPDILDLFN